MSTFTMRIDPELIEGLRISLRGAPANERAGGVSQLFRQLARLYLGEQLEDPAHQSLHSCEQLIDRIEFEHRLIGRLCATEERQIRDVFDKVVQVLRPLPQEPSLFRHRCLLLLGRCSALQTACK
jgi:hypothetical protein